MQTHDPGIRQEDLQPSNLVSLDVFKGLLEDLERSMFLSTLWLPNITCSFVVVFVLLVRSD